MPHTPEEIARFLDGETRLVGAAWAGDPDRAPFMLPDGEAHKHRALTKSSLRCIVRDCAEPALTTVGGTRRRHHFRHTARGGGGHAVEGFHHVQGKAVVAAWLRQRYPTSRVEVEYGLDTQRTRIADVMLIGADGSRVAFEIQYAAISVEDLRARTADYAAAGVGVVWMFGHVGHQLKRLRAGRRGGERFLMSPTHEAVRALGAPLLWLNPLTAQIGTAVTRHSWQGHGFALASTGRAFDLELEPLSLLEVRTGGVISPMLSMLAGNGLRWTGILEQEAVAALERQRHEAIAANAEAIRRAKVRAEALARAKAQRGGTPNGQDSDGLMGAAHRAESRAGLQQARGSGKAGPVCKRCGIILDPIYHARGYHGMCDPNWGSPSYRR